MSEEIKTTELYQNLSTPPEWALKVIKGGRLKGMTDIKPQWRIEAMNEQFGDCGFDWWYEVDNKWIEQGANNELVAFAEVSVFYVKKEKVSKPLKGTGGSMFVANEKNGLHTSDEAYKMAITDAISVALKFIGVGADIYKGTSDSKYDENEQEEPKTFKDFVEEIAKANNVKYLGSLWYKYKEIWKEDTEEYKQLNKFAGNKKLSIQQPESNVDILNGLNAITVEIIKGVK